MKSISRVVSFFLLAIGASAAMALPISGNIAFYGISTVEDTTISFNSANVAYVDGDFAADGVMVGDVVAFSSFDYAVDPFAGVPSLWSVGNFTFDLETITLGTPTAGVDLSMAGRGFLSHAAGINDDGMGYDRTEYYWEYSGNDIIGNIQVFSSSVPEPGSLALLGLGLIGLGVAGYGRRRQA